ncbi:GxxExxY protein [Marivirga sp.]|uniref:GxxExxY protein n=1 Tax=Marivirga sp. TaxID=2018662 RepID=UPI002D7FEA5E|nr:GxxExxY protein [Marivirga sp.]HET8860571.1 GxxExxY protein [Marivirga sp.]
MTENDLSRIVVNASFQVHNELGPGLLENIYEECLFSELQDAGIHVEKEVVLPVKYKNKKMDLGYRLDIWVERKLIIELKCVDSFIPIHKAQLLTYLKLTNNRLGLLINFNVPLIKDGIKRVVNNL